MTSRTDAQAREARTVVGRVLTFDRRTGYGFIRVDRAGSDAPDVFLHVSELPGTLKDTLKAGDHVEFDTRQSDQGLKAVRVRLAGSGDSAPEPALPDPETISTVEFGMVIAPAVALVKDRVTRSQLISRLLVVAREHGWVEGE